MDIFIYIALSVILAVIIVGLIARQTNQRRKQQVEVQRNYSCLSSKMAWGDSDNSTDGQIKHIPTERDAHKTSQIVF